MSRINGHTQVYGVIGDPIGHSFSPQIHAYFAQQCGKNWAYLPFHVTGENIPAALAGAHALGIRGLNVTIPHKQAVMPHLARVAPMAQRVGSVNTLLWTPEGYIGTNTDYAGIQRSLSAVGENFAGKAVAVLGAGGSAYAACVAAAEGGASGIVLFNRSVKNAQFLATHVNTYYNTSVRVIEGFDEPEHGCTIVLQTTSVGFGAQEGRSPVAGAAFFEGVQTALDVVYAPWETAFLRQARAAGVPTTLNGFPMLVYQAAEAFCLWAGAAPEELSDAYLPEYIAFLGGQCQSGA